MRRSCSQGLLCALVLLSAGCATLPAERPAIASQARPIVSGTPDDEDPAVVALVRANDPASLRCSGTLVAERVVLTAAHCGAQNEPSYYQVHFGPTLGNGGTRIAILDAVAHPDYDGTVDHDLALLLLAEPAPAPAAPVPLVDAPDIAASPPVSLRLVGYGVTDATAADADARKREGQVETVEVLPLHVVVGPAPALPCSGDSGGPGFLDAGQGERLAGVISRGDEACSEYGRLTRVDAHLTGFIQPQLAAWAPGAATTGEPCLYDEQCTGGLCVTAEDAPIFHYCSAGCERNAECPEPLVCVEHQCRYREPTPGALGSACESPADCFSGECLHDPTLPDGPICSTRCVAGVSDCPAGFECTHLGDVKFYCLPEPTARGCGCGQGGTGALPAVWLLLLLAYLKISRRYETRRGARSERPAVPSGSCNRSQGHQL